MGPALALAMSRAKSRVHSQATRCKQEESTNGTATEEEAFNVSKTEASVTPCCDDDEPRGVPAVP
jgi:hypothetical protein